MKRFIKWLKSSSSDRFLLLVAVILINLVSINGFFRFDLTSQRAYSLSKASKEVIKHIDSPLSVKVFFSKNLPAPYNNVEQYLTDILTEYKSNGSKYFSYQVYDMSKEENQQQAQSLGIYPVQIDQVETSGFSSKIAWMGVAITYGDYIAAIDSLKTTTDIEYKITTTITKIINAQENNNEQLFEIGYIKGHGEHELRSNPYAQYIAQLGCEGFRNLLSDIYSIKEIDITNSEIPSKIKTIIINGPQQTFSQDQILKIDNFIKNGGNAVFFIDPLKELPAQQNSFPQYIPNVTGLEPLLSEYGITIENKMIFDDECVIQYQNTGKQLFNFAPVVDKKRVAKNHPVTKNLGGIVFYTVGPVTIDPAKNKNITVLAKTSDKSWATDKNIVLYPGYTLPSEDDSELKENIIAVTAEVPSKIVVVSSSIITTDILVNQDKSPTELFIKNVVDYASGNEDFCEMRTKGTRLDFISIKSQKSALIIQLLNEFGLAVIVVLIGFVAWRMKITRQYLIGQKYNPNDSRFIDKKDSSKYKEDKDND
ncbi:MAG: GldG family protein [Treponema sp.]|nr:GldG family protein [Treponema sp.]